MPSFVVGAFALAGVAAAAGPIVAHLMNRRRFRTVNWAAMNFLREAVRQSRRVLHLRDLLLLLLRIACVLLFGLAMARPFFTGGGPAATNSGEGADGEARRSEDAIHAVIAVDNSLSMAYRSVNGTLLDEAKAKCRKFIEDLPDDGRVTIIPICDTHTSPVAPAASKDAAIKTLDKIQPVDRTATLDLALSKAEEALALVPTLPNKRTVLVGDNQRLNFPAGGVTGNYELARSDLQLVTVAPDVLENTWVAELRALDDVAIADGDTPFVVVIHHQGPTRRPGVQVRFIVDGQLAGTQTIDLEPDQRREIVYSHRYPALATNDERRFTVFGVHLTEDRLPQDDVRELVVPVVDPLSVIYATEHGPSADHSSTRNLWLRRLLAPADAGDAGPKFVKIDDIPFSSLTPKMLEDARLVVLADVRSPLDRVPLLRDYVEQGGRLLIVAGEEFDPKSWQDLGWRDGGGILPTPIALQKIDVRATAPPKPLRFDLRSTNHEYFQIEGESQESLDALYSAPGFLQVVSAEPTAASQARLTRFETERIAARRKAAEDAEDAADDKPDEPESPPPSPPLVRLLWPEPRADNDHTLAPEVLAAEWSRVAVIGRYNNGLPFLLERMFDRGQIVFCTTGLQSAASTLTDVRAVVVLDRLVREMIERTLPQRNFDTLDSVKLPIRPQGSDIYLRLVRPDQSDSPLAVDSLGDDKYSLTLADLASRGAYRVAAHEIDADGNAAEQVAWELPFAVTGSENESHLEAIDADEAVRLIGDANVRRVAGAQAIRTTGANVRGESLWKWLMGLVLVCLLVELVLIVCLRPAANPKPAEAPA